MSLTATVSILTYTAIEHSERCVDTVLRHSPEHLKLILTSNGNPAAEAMFRKFEQRNPGRIRIVVNSQNSGFIIPNRRAFELCDTELFILLNDDALVPAGWVEALSKPFEIDPKCALSGPSGSCCTLNERFHGFVGNRFEYLEGSCLAGRTELLKKHGLFSPELQFAYGEDSDLSLRMREQGYNLHRAAFQLTSHARAATSRSVPQVREFQAKNHAYLQKRWGSYLKTRRFDNPIIIRRLGAHGDVLLLTPIIRALKDQNPKSTIYVQTTVPEVLKNHPLVTKAARLLGNMAGARQIMLDGSYEAKPAQHFVKTYAEIAGVPCPPLKLEIFPLPEDRAWAESRMAEGSWVVIHPGPSTWPGKEWTKERFNLVAQELRKTGLKVALVGSHDVGIECDFDSRGRTTIMQMASIIGRAKLFIGLDSLPMHVSQAVGTPTIGLFGVTDPQFISTEGSWFRGICGTGPRFGMRHRVNGKTHVNDSGETMKTITVEQVLAAAQEGLAHVAPNT